MASEEHKTLAQFLKDVHSSLRQSSSNVGAKRAWTEHCEKKEVLEKYARSMEKLATEHWDINSSKLNSVAKSRIQWTADECYNYFIKKSFLISREKESVIASKIEIDFTLEEHFTEPIKLLDVGSCYNPFRAYEFIEVFAIDLFPANEYVYQCDFLNVKVGNKTEFVDNKVTELKEGAYEAIAFCFLLEYIPSSDLRIAACEKAYSLLKPGGLLVINTPDSKHVGANCKIMKCWRYALAVMGFSRIKYEKFVHMHCMTFRKALCKQTAVRWATLHKELYMEYCLNIPQDKQDIAVASQKPSNKLEAVVEVTKNFPEVL